VLGHRETYPVGLPEAERVDELVFPRVTQADAVRLVFGGHPVPGAVDSLAVDRELVPESPEALGLGLGDRPVRAGTHVDEHVPVLRDHVHEVADERRHRKEVVRGSEIVQR
jgi:hypothetical protein